MVIGRIDRPSGGYIVHVADYLICSVFRLWVGGKKSKISGVYTDSLEMALYFIYLSFNFFDPEPEYEIYETIRYMDNVAAGRPIYASEDQSTISVPKRYIKTKSEDYYAVQIKGTSMVAAGIPDAVRVLIRISDTPRDGAIQVVEYQGEVTLKQIREIPGGGWKICFDDYSGRYIEIGPGDEFHIQGDFVMVLPEDGK
jgi:SOS-response transcriptional repressor LexA